ncbi:MAG: Cytochrome c554 [Chlorobi bacterium OLB5]|nr:MAG: Cytochrome c554 [Chlorobi bacterium OLB5]
MYNLLQKEFSFSNSVISQNYIENYKLYQNFPPSFYKMTRIAFDIPKESNVKIVIYDVFGQDKEVLLNENLQPGSYELKWNASNLKAGVYYYKLYAENFVDSKKILLIKN